MTQIFSEDKKRELIKKNRVNVLICNGFSLLSSAGLIGFVLFNVYVGYSFLMVIAHSLFFTICLGTALIIALESMRGIKNYTEAIQSWLEKKNEDEIEGVITEKADAVYKKVPCYKFTILKDDGDSVFVYIEQTEKHQFELNKRYYVRCFRGFVTAFEERL